MMINFHHFGMNIKLFGTFMDFSISLVVLVCKSVQQKNYVSTKRMKLKKAIKSGVHFRESK